MNIIHIPLGKTKQNGVQIKDNLHDFSPIFGSPWAQPWPATFMLQTIKLSNIVLYK